MDPEACLARCEQFVQREHGITDAVEALTDYWTWRSLGGHQPENGDARARHAALRIIERIARLSS